MQTLYKPVTAPNTRTSTITSCDASSPGVVHQERGVAQLPASEVLLGGEDDGHADAEEADDDVRDAQERIAAAEEGQRRQH